MENQEKPFKEKRKLAAIMFTDIEGFTRMMAKDEPTTMRRLEGQIWIMKELIIQYKGRLVKTPREFKRAIELNANYATAHN